MGSDKGLCACLDFGTSGCVMSTQDRSAWPPGCSQEGRQSTARPTPALFLSGFARELCNGFLQSMTTEQWPSPTAVDCHVHLRHAPYRCSLESHHPELIIAVWKATTQSSSLQFGVTGHGHKQDAHSLDTFVWLVRVTHQFCACKPRTTSAPPCSRGKGRPALLPSMLHVGNAMPRSMEQGAWRAHSFRLLTKFERLQIC